MPITIHIICCCVVINNVYPTVALENSDKAYTEYHTEYDGHKNMCYTKLKMLCRGIYLKK